MKMKSRPLRPIMCASARRKRLSKRVGEYMNLVVTREPPRQLDDVAAVPARPLEIMRDQADAHADTVGFDLRTCEKSARSPSTWVSSVYRDARR